MLFMAMAILMSIVAGVSAGYVGLADSLGLGLTVTASLLSIGFFITHAAELISGRR